MLYTQETFNNFHPRVIIVNHFDNVKSQIDIYTETILQDQSLSEDRRNKVNDAREKQLNKLNETANLNLNQFENFDEDTFMAKWKDVLNDDSIDNHAKLTIIEEDIILFDCVLVENAQISNGLILWVTSWFYKPTDLEFLK
jgi:hypothetical protein